MTNQTELRVIELIETVEGEPDPFFYYTIQYRNDGGQWISLPVVRVFDRDTYETMQGGADVTSQIPSPEAIVRAALERAADLMLDGRAYAVEEHGERSLVVADMDARHKLIRNLASDTAEVAVIIKKAGGKHELG